MVSHLSSQAARSPAPFAVATCRRNECTLDSTLELARGVMQENMEPRGGSLQKANATQTSRERREG